MPSNCSVFGCLNTYKKIKGSNIKYYHYPKLKDYRDEWLHASGRADKVNAENVIVCSVHFRPEDYNDDLMSRLLDIDTPDRHRLLKVYVVLNLYIPHGEYNQEMKDLYSHAITYLR